MLPNVLLLPFCALVATILMVATSITFFNNGQNPRNYRAHRLKRSVGDERITVCTSPACVSQSAVMKSTMDPSLDPCRNFYQYACAGRWNSGAKNSESSFLRLEVEHHLILKGMLEQPTDTLVSETERRVKRYYESCLQMMNTPKENKLGPAGEALLRILNQTGGWQIVDELFNIKRDDYFQNNPWNFKETFQTVQSVFNVGLFFSWTLQVPTTIVTNSVYPDQHTIKIDHGGLTLDNPNDYFNGTLNYTLTNLVAKVIAGFFLNNDSSNIIMRPDFVSVVNDIIEVETRIAQITPPTHSYVFVSSITDLNGRAPFIDWHHFFQSSFSQVNVRIVSSHNVLVSSLDFLQQLSVLVNELLATNRGQTKLRNYISWHTTFHYFKILEKMWSKREANAANLWNDCIIDTVDAMDFAVTAMYVRKRSDSEPSKRLAESMTKSIKESFKENLKNLVWLDEETSRAVKDKIDIISNWIGYPEFIRNYTKLDEIYGDLHMESSNYFMNNVRLEQHSFRSQLITLDKPVIKSEWDAISFSVLPSFAQGSNIIKLPIGILRQPFFDITFPPALNFGSIGAVIGHELVHGFDNEGRKHDRKGLLRRWWNDAAIERFEKRAECFKQQYSSFTVNSLSVDGEQTLDENIADNSGLKTAFSAYKSWAYYSHYVFSLPGINIEQDKLFFLSYAQSFCSKRLEDEDLGSTYTHSPDSYRVIGSLSNMQEFSTTFQCPPGSPMNPVEKCEIW